MPLPQSGKITLGQIKDEYNEQNPNVNEQAELADYYRAPEGLYVPDTRYNSKIPTSGTIKHSDFYGSRGAIKLRQQFHISMYVDGVEVVQFFPNTRRLHMSHILHSLVEVPFLGGYTTQQEVKGGWKGINIGGRQQLAYGDNTIPYYIIGGLTSVTVVKLAGRGPVTRTWNGQPGAMVEVKVDDDAPKARDSYGFTLTLEGTMDDYPGT